MHILDAHAHCGITLPFEKLLPRWKEGGISGGVLFSPAEEIYDRFQASFVDSPYYKKSRERVHHYLQSLTSGNIFIYWFVWNDFLIPGKEFSGIKWHRHPDEPRYQYKTPECENFIEYICQNKMPVVLEEELTNTIELVKKFDGRTTTIIPHFGNLNGGYYNLKKAGLFENPAVYVDTSLANPFQIKDFASDYGVERILFGSDFPFGDPASECFKLKNMFSQKELEQVYSGNLLRLLK